MLPGARQMFAGGGGGPVSGEMRVVLVSVEYIPDEPTYVFTLRAPGGDTFTADSFDGWLTWFEYGGRGWDSDTGFNSDMTGGAEETFHAVQ